jgi:hypothetical protein
MQPRAPRDLNKNSLGFKGNNLMFIIGSNKFLRDSLEEL